MLRIFFILPNNLLYSHLSYSFIPFCISEIFDTAALRCIITCFLLQNRRSPFSCSLRSQPASFSHLVTNSILITLKDCFSAVCINIRSTSYFRYLGFLNLFHLLLALTHPADFSLLIGCEVHPGRGRSVHGTKGCKRVLLNLANSSQKLSSGTSKCR